jgi:hypothetical protein
MQVKYFDLRCRKSLLSVKVQQPCSNPSKSPELLRKASTQKYGCLQGFYKLQKPSENYRAFAFTRQRSLVRTQHRPLKKLQHATRV